MLGDTPVVDLCYQEDSQAQVDMNFVMNEKGDLIELQFMGNAYNPQVGSAVALVMMILIFVCMAIMNRVDDGSGEEGGLLL